MPTEVFEIADSQDIEFNEGISGARVKLAAFTSDYSNQIIDSVKAGLIAAGWSQTGATKPTVFVTFPYGLPTATDDGDPTTPVVVTNNEYVLSVQGIAFYLYDAYRFLPGSTGVWIPAAGSVAASMSALTNAIAANTVWSLKSYNVAPDGAHNIVLEASVEGTQYNHPGNGGEGELSGARFWSNAHDCEGGGWILRASMIDGTYLEVWVYALSRSVFFEFRSSAGGERPTYEIRPSTAGGSIAADYSLIANQFQFCLMREKSADTTSFLLASLMHKEHGCEYAAAIVASGNRVVLAWAHNSAGGRDGGLHRSTSTASGLKVYAFRSLGSGGELKTSQGYNLISSAWVSIPSSTGDARIAGKLFDALVLSRPAALDDRMVFRELLWHCIAREETFGSTPASLWLAYDDAPTS